MLRLLLFVVPLGLDTFAVSAALGTRGVTPRERLRLSLLMAGFETAMPVVGLLLGRGLGALIGGAADYVAAAALLALGGYLLLSPEREEGERLAASGRVRGLALLALGLGISLDELAMGFTIGLLHLSLVAAVIVIGVQGCGSVRVSARPPLSGRSGPPGWRCSRSAPSSSPSTPSKNSFQNDPAAGGAAEPPLQRGSRASTCAPSRSSPSSRSTRGCRT